MLLCKATSAMLAALLVAVVPDVSTYILAALVAVVILAGPWRLEKDRP